ncbi:hypothetical protein [Flavitalea sp.]|nr:hypothetical protein [Flavitalea sp.]
MNNTSDKTPDEENHAFEVWKYYGGVGGTDKDTMIKIVTWLLGFSAASIGVYTSVKSTDFPARVLPIIGIVFSILGAYIAILYGAYVAWNWAIADRIAEDNGWTKQKPDYRPFQKSDNCIAFWLAKPCNNKIAPVFKFFFWVSIVSLVIHGLLLFFGK